MTNDLVYEEYHPACSCGWCQPEDTYYQIIDNEYVSLEVHFEEIDGVYEARPHPVAPQKVYPMITTSSLGWTEIHYCPVCKKEYGYIVPCKPE